MVGEALQTATLSDRLAPGDGWVTKLELRPDSTTDLRGAGLIGMQANTLFEFGIHWRTRFGTINSIYRLLGVFGRQVVVEDGGTLPHEFLVLRLRLLGI